MGKRNILRRLLGEARKPTKLTPDEEGVLDKLRRDLRMLDFSNFDLSDFKKLSVLKSLQKKGMIYIQLRIRFEPKGYDW